MRQWSKIKTKKGAADAKKSAVFGKAYRVSPILHVCHDHVLIYVPLGHNGSSEGYALILRHLGYLSDAWTGGGSADPGLNSALAAVLKNAKSVGVPKDNIEKALAKV